MLSELWNIKYCENISNLFFSEPLNFLSNILYFVIAFILRYSLKKSKHLTLRIKILVIMIGIVGLGSAVWHWHIDHTSIYFDVIPITIFTIYSLYLLFEYLFKSQKEALFYLMLSWMFIISMSYFLRTYFYSDVFNGSYEYFAVSLVILFIFIIKYKVFFLHIKKISYLVILFIIAIICRQIDLSVCNFFLFGTHFLWHIFNAFASYILVNLFAKDFMKK